MNYTCKETCNMDKPCGNRHCSANPKYIPPLKKDKPHPDFLKRVGFYRYK